MADVPFYALDQQRFEELIAESGKLVTWRAGYRCSCWKEASGSPDYECKACGGIGYVYQTPYTVHALMTAIDMKKDFLPVGEWRMGDITCTVPNRLREIVPFEPPKTGYEIRWNHNPMWIIGEGDLVTLPDSEQRTSEILVRDQPLWLRPANTLLHPPESILEVLALSVSDPASGVVTTFEAGEEGVDYTVDADTVTWDPASVKDFTVLKNVVNFNPNGTNAQTLLEGQQYSVTYTHLVTYIVYMQLPMPRDHYGKMPRKVILRLRGVGLK